MPRMTRRGGDVATTPVDGAVALVASATRFPASVTRIHQAPKNWQAEAWRHYDICGELRYAASYVGNILSRATLHVARISTEGLRQVTDGPGYDALRALFSGPDGQEQMLHAFGVHLTIAGEAYLIGRKEGGEDLWEVVGTQEVSRAPGTNGRADDWWLDFGDGIKRALAEDDVIIRVWRPHPRRRIEADSPVRALLPILTEIEYLTRHIFAQVQSRLAGAGILSLPQGMTFPAVPGTVGTQADQFMAVLGEAMIKPIQDPGSPAALVPIVITVPDELVGKMEHLTFWSDLDQHAVELRTEAIRRLGLGMDVPPEVLLGSQDNNHWSAWMVEESTIKAHMEPLLGLISNALTVGYLRPAIDGDLETVIAHETSQMRLRPNRSREAIELYDRGELDGEALRRETGFTEDDRPDESEFRAWLLRKVASGSTTPEQVAAALAELGIIVPGASKVDESQRGAFPPSLRRHPKRDLPETLLAASEVLVFRALERAGNRIRSHYSVRPAGIAAPDLYRYVAVRPGDVDMMLSDSFACAPRVLERFDTDVSALVRALEGYTRELLRNQGEHSFDAMCAVLGCSPQDAIPQDAIAG